MHRWYKKSSSFLVFSLALAGFTLLACDPFDDKHACTIDEECLDGRVCGAEGWCVDPGPAMSDAGISDSASPDLQQSPDAGTSDSASPDLQQSPDAALADSGSEDLDSPVEDASIEPDAQVSDATQEDASEADAGLSDAGLMDQGWEDDASVADAGVEMDAAEPLPGDVCEDATDLGSATASGGATWSVSGSLQGYADDSIATSCVGCYPGQPDRVYSFSTTQIFDLDVTLTASSGGWTPLVYLHESCDGPEIDARYGAPVASIHQGRLPAGDYVLYVDSATDLQAQDFDLEVVLSVPADGDSCHTAWPLVFGEENPDVAIMTGDLRDMNDDSTGSSCTGTYYGVPDSVYVLELSKTRSVAIEVQRDDGT